MARFSTAGRTARRGGLQPLSPRRKWWAITIATLILAPAYWAMLVGLIAFASDDSGVADTTAAAAVAFGLAVIPFVFISLAFLSEHPQAPGAVVRAMALCLLVGVLVSAIAADGVTGIVAGVGAGGAIALRADLPHDRRTRAAAVALAALYTFVLIRAAPALALVPAPVFPLTAIGLADHWSERRETGRDRSPEALADARARSR